MFPNGLPCNLPFPSCLGVPKDSGSDELLPASMENREPVILNVYDMVKKNKTNIFVSNYYFFFFVIKFCICIQTFRFTLIFFLSLIWFCFQLLLLCNCIALRCSIGSMSIQQIQVQEYFIQALKFMALNLLMVDIRFRLPAYLKFHHVIIANWANNFVLGETK